MAAGPQHRIQPYKDELCRCVKRVFPGLMWTLERVGVNFEIGGWSCHVEMCCCFMFRLQ